MVKAVGSDQVKWPWKDAKVSGLEFLRYELLTEWFTLEDFKVAGETGDSFESCHRA